MRGLWLTAAAAALFAGGAAQAQDVESGVPRGSLAVAAIERGDLDRAEVLLQRSVLDRDDPARLINLGYVYQRQGRSAEAIAAWRAALAAPRHRVIETMGGREVRTDDLAREMLARHQTVIASR